MSIKKLPIEETINPPMIGPTPKNLKIVLIYIYLCQLHDRE